MIPVEVLAAAKKLGIDHLRDVNHDGKIDMSDVNAIKAKMDAAKAGKGGSK